MNWPEPDSGGFLATLLAAVVTVGGAIMAARKKLSGDTTALARDTTAQARESAERDMMGNLRGERDKYLSLWEAAQKQANEFAVVNAELRGHVDQLTKDNAALSLQVSRLDNTVRDMRRLMLTAMPERAGEILASDFTPLKG